MIINDINYLEATNEEVFGGSSVRVDKGVGIDVGVSLDFDTDVNVDIDKNIDADLSSTVSITGNFANLTGDATAIGDNGFAETDFAVTVTDDLAEVSVSSTAAVA